jgi:uncharacterized membrane protein YfcA
MRVGVLAEPSRRRWGALGGGAAVGTLGGLIGLGGAEFRLPLLIGGFGFKARVAVPLNLLISLVTVAAALVGRLLFLEGSPVAAHGLEIVAIAAGAITAAWFGAGWLAAVSDHVLEPMIAVLLLAIAALLVTQALLPSGLTLDPPTTAAAKVALGLACGAVIGTVSSLLGVAGGELIIPVLVFLFAVDIKTAGTASLIISLPTVAIGLVRYWRSGAFAGRGALREVAAPMAVGSVLGANLGAALAGIAPSGVIKLLLGLVLAASALKLLHRGR